MTGMFHPKAMESLEAKSDDLGIPFNLSFVGSHTPEAVKAVRGRAPWHQFYWPRDEDVQKDILDRMKALGVEVIMPTLDIPGHQWRERTVRSGASAQPSPLVLARDLLPRPGWVANVLKHGKPGLPNIEMYSGGGTAEAEQWLLQNCLRPIGPETIKKLLATQVTSPVLWENTMDLMLSSGFEKAYECGPGKVTAGILKRFSKTAPCTNVEV